MRKSVLSVLIPLLSGFSAYAAQGPLLVPDYNRDGVIDLSVEGAMASKGEAFTVWLNDDNDAAGAEADDGNGDTNTDLHDVPGGEGNDKDCEDYEVNGRCDLLDFFPVLIDLNGVEGSGDYTWKLISKSVNVVFTQLKAETAGDDGRTEAGKGGDAAFDAGHEDRVRGLDLLEHPMEALGVAVTGAVVIRYIL